MTALLRLHLGTKATGKVPFVPWAQRCRLNVTFLHSHAQYTPWYLFLLCLSPSSEYTRSEVWKQSLGPLLHLNNTFFFIIQTTYVILTCIWLMVSRWYEKIWKILLGIHIIYKSFYTLHHSKVIFEDQVIVISGNCANKSLFGWALVYGLSSVTVTYESTDFIGQDQTGAVSCSRNILPPSPIFTKEIEKIVRKRPDFIIPPIKTLY